MHGLRDRIGGFFCDGQTEKSVASEALLRLAELATAYAAFAVTGGTSDTTGTQLFDNRGRSFRMLRNSAGMVDLEDILRGAQHYNSPQFPDCV